MARSISSVHRSGGAALRKTLASYSPALHPGFALSIAQSWLQLSSLGGCRRSSSDSEKWASITNTSPTAVGRHFRRLHTTAVLRPRVVVVGGGFGGLSTALKLSQLPWTRLTRPEITLVDRADRFSFLPMMYELATGEVEAWEVAPQFDTLLKGTSINFVQATVDSIDLRNTPTLHLHPSGNSSLDAPTDLLFDRAVVAVGAQPASRTSVPGATEYSCTLYSHNDAISLRERIDEILRLKSSSVSQVANVVVVGAGFAGVETAACLAEKLGTAGSVVLVDRGDRILPRGESFSRLAAERVLADLGVTVEQKKRVQSVGPDSITLLPATASVNKDTSGQSSGSTSSSVGTTLPADLVIWTAGTAPSATLGSLGLPLVEGTGRVDVDELLQVRGHEDVVFALGDAASVPTTGANGGYSGTAQVAIQQADYAAWNVWASLTGRKKLQYRYLHLGEMLVLGSRSASVSTQLGLQIDGTVAWAARRAAYAARMPTERHRARVAASWAVTPVASDVASVIKQATCMDTMSL